MTTKKTAEREQLRYPCCKCCHTTCPGRADQTRTAALWHREPCKTHGANGRF